MAINSQSQPHLAFFRALFGPTALVIAAFLTLSGCSIEASMNRSLSSIGAGSELPPPTNTSENFAPDFIAGEIVTTGNGVVLKGTFGEISEKIILSNGVRIEGSFY